MAVPDGNLADLIQGLLTFGFPEVRKKKKPKTSDTKDGKNSESELGKRYLDRVNKHFNCSNCEDMGYSVIRSGKEIVGVVECGCSN